MTTTIVLSTLFGTVASYPLLRRGLRLNENALGKIERLCAWVLFPFLLMGAVETLFVFYSQTYALLLTIAAIIVALTWADLWLHVSKGLAGILFVMFILGIVVLLKTGVTALSSPLWHWIVEDELAEFWFLIWIIVNSCIYIFWAMAASAYFKSLLTREDYGWRAMNFSFTAFVIVGILASEYALISAAADRFPVNEPGLCAWIGGKRAKPALMAALMKDDEEVRNRAAVKLIEIGETKALIEVGKSVVPTLILTLKDSESKVQEQAAETLGEIGDSSAIPALETVDRACHTSHDCKFCKALTKLKAK
ncbi:MAG: HEAT repeat domain-containing protein [Acidobacteria bacterium]|nr:HEAT repeat domain-containing protein [Acidobacteriota bacterium]